MPENDDSIVASTIEALIGQGLDAGKIKEHTEELKKAINATQDFTSAQKIALANRLEILKSLEDSTREVKLLAAAEKEGADEKRELAKAINAAKESLESFRDSQSAHIMSLKEEIGFNEINLSQLKKIEKIYESGLGKKLRDEGERANRKARKSLVELFESYETYDTNVMGEFLKTLASENAVLQGLTGVRGTLYGDYYAQLDELTNSVDTGFRSMIRSGIRFTGNLKDIFENTIDPIQGLAEDESLRIATEKMGGMFKSIGLDGLTANKALTALKNNTSLLRESFIKTSPDAEAVALHFASLTQGLAKLGIAEEDTATTLDFFVKGLRQTPKEASESVRALENMAHQLDINVSTAFKDFISLQGNLAQFGDDTNRVFADLQAQAVSTGVSVGDLNSVAERLDTFKGAAQAAQGFNAVLGQTVVSVTDLVHAEPAEKIQILKDALDRSGISFDSANRRIKSMIAGFMGVDVAKASKIFGSEDDFFTLRNNIDGSATSMEELDKRINESMTNAEAMTKTASNLGKASAQAVDRARENAQKASNTLMSIIAQMGQRAKQPIEMLISLRRALQGIQPAETAAGRITGLATTTSAAIALAKALLEDQVQPGGTVENILKMLEKLPGVGEGTLYHTEGGKLRFGQRPEERQSGGPVMPHRPYIVGDGPGNRGEMFVPSTSGRIVPNNQLAGGETTIQLQFNSPLQIVGADGAIMTVGQFDKSFERKFNNAALRAPNPVVLS